MRWVGCDVIIRSLRCGGTVDGRLKEVMLWVKSVVVVCWNRSREKRKKKRSNGS